MAKVEAWSGIAGYVEADRIKAMGHAALLAAEAELVRCLSTKDRPGDIEIVMRHDPAYLAVSPAFVAAGRKYIGKGKAALIRARIEDPVYRAAWDDFMPVRNHYSRLEDEARARLGLVRLRLAELRAEPESLTATTDHTEPESTT